MINKPNKSISKEKKKEHTRGVGSDLCNYENEQDNLAKTTLGVAKVLDEPLARLQNMSGLQDLR